MCSVVCRDTRIVIKVNTVVKQHLFFSQVFDTTRKITYKNLTNWYKELRQHRPEIPCVCGANKIDGENMFIHSDSKVVLLLFVSDVLFSAFVYA